jgi:hypothetical protein
MSPIPDDQFAALVAASPLQAKYGTTVDRQSAYELIQARLDAARASAAAQQAAAQQPVPPTAGAPSQPVPQPGTITMTPGELRRDQQRVAREAREQQRAAARERKAQAAAAKRAREEELRAERARQRSIDNAIRTGGRVATSRMGQDIIRGVFGTLFGGKR